MTADEIIEQLSKLGTESYRATMSRHGAPKKYFGVKIEELKKFQKKIKKDHELSLALFDSGIGDAMYLAGLIADESRMTKSDLRRWVKQATWGMIGEYSVAWVAAESRYGYELGTEWISSKQDHVAAAGWNTLSSLAALKPDNELPVKEYGQLLDQIAKTIHGAPNRVRYTMNNFIIAAGSGIKALTDKARRVAKQVGKVEVDMGDTACKVPDAGQSIAKIAAMGRVGHKRKTVRC